MKEINAEIILDSVISGRRVTCMRVTYPRIVHAEFMRHRCGSYCSVSSRATPLNRMISQYCGFVPSKWRKHQPGMQPNEDENFSEEELHKIWVAYENIMNDSKTVTEHLHSIGVAKEQVNRLIEPYLFITHLVQMTDIGYESFFKLRLPKTAQYEIRQIAQMMHDVYRESKPVTRGIHAPFYQKEIDAEIDESVEDFEKLRTLFKASSARCARTSYFNHDGSTPTLEQDLELSKKLEKDLHLSPFEFPVMSYNITMQMFDNVLFTEPIPSERLPISNSIRMYKDLSGNLNDWKIVQYRKIMEQLLNK